VHLPAALGAHTGRLQAAMQDEDHMDGAGEMEIDPDLPILDRIERYCASGSLVQRLVFVREIASCAEEVGAAETVGRIVPLLKVIVCDPEQQVRQVSIAGFQILVPL
jgi:serine/threonine-protein phosphatase 4 regulatory subunit 1